MRETTGRIDRSIKGGRRPESIGMTLDQAQAALKPHKRPLESQPLIFWALGLGEEAGEVQGVVKKATHREVYERAGNDVVDQYDARLLTEAGNVLFYLRQVLELRGLTLEMAVRRQVEILEQIETGDR